jgi:hypothetical protein
MGMIDKIKNGFSEHRNNVRENDKETKEKWDNTKDKINDYRDKNKEKNQELKDKQSDKIDSAKDRLGIGDDKKDSKKEDKVDDNKEDKVDVGNETEPESGENGASNFIDGLNDENLETAFYGGDNGFGDGEISFGDPESDSGPKKTMFGKESREAAAGIKEEKYDKDLVENGDWKKDVVTDFDTGEKSVNYTLEDGDKEYQIQLDPNRGLSPEQRKVTENGEEVYSDKGSLKIGNDEEAQHAADLEGKMSPKPQEETQENEQGTYTEAYISYIEPGDEPSLPDSGQQVQENSTQPFGPGITGDTTVSDQNVPLNQAGEPFGPGMTGNTPVSDHQIPLGQAGEQFGPVATQTDPTAQATGQANPEIALLAQAQRQAALMQGLQGQQTAPTGEANPEMALMAKAQDQSALMQGLQGQQAAPTEVAGQYQPAAGFDQANGANQAAAPVNQQQGAPVAGQYQPATGFDPANVTNPAAAPVDQQQPAGTVETTSVSITIETVQQQQQQQQQQTTDTPDPAMSPMTAAASNIHKHQEGIRQLNDFSSLAANGIAGFAGIDENSAPNAVGEIQNQVNQNTMMAEGYQSGALQHIPGSGMDSPQDVFAQQQIYNEAAAKQYRDQQGLPPEAQGFQEFALGNNALSAAQDIRESQQLGFGQ